MLCKFSKAQGLPEVGTVRAEDQMDDGAHGAVAAPAQPRAGW